MPKITAYFRAHPSEQDTAAAVIISKLAPLEQRRGIEGGEVYPEKHGIFDGQYWLQSLPPHQVGFVEGYLECNRSGNLAVGRFSRDAQSYVDRISEWYRLQPDDSMDRERSREKIADVLARFKDYR